MSASARGCRRCSGVSTPGGGVDTIHQLSPRPIYPQHDVGAHRPGADTPGRWNRNRRAAPVCRFIVAHGPAALHSTKEKAVGPNMFVSVTIQCRCGFEWVLCVPVGVGVPEPLRCHPGAPIAVPGVGRSDVCCPRCRFTLFPGDPALRSRVEDELRRGRGTHVRAGTVVIDCR